MARIHQQRFSRRHVEEPRIEVARLVHEAPEPRGCCACVLVLTAVEIFDVEAIFGNFFTQVLFRQDDVPKFFDIVAAWAASRHSYNGNSA